MEMLTKEEFDTLTEYADRLATAANSDYIRALSSNVVHTYRMIYSRLIGETYSMNEHCGSCVLELCKRLKPYYDAYEKEANKGNTSGDTTETKPDTTEASGGEKQTRNKKRTKKQS